MRKTTRISGAGAGACVVPCHWPVRSTVCDHEIGTVTVPSNNVAARLATQDRLIGKPFKLMRFVLLLGRVLTLPNTTASCRALVPLDSMFIHLWQARMAGH